MRRRLFVAAGLAVVAVVAAVVVYGSQDDEPPALPASGAPLQLAPADGATARVNGPAPRFRATNPAPDRETSVTFCLSSSAKLDRHAALDCDLASTGFGIAAGTERTVTDRIPSITEKAQTVYWQAVRDDCEGQSPDVAQCPRPSTVRRLTIGR